MSQEELKKKMQRALDKAGKSEMEISLVVPYILAQNSLQSDESRLIFYNEWKKDEA